MMVPSIPDRAQVVRSFKDLILSDQWQAWFRTLTAYVNRSPKVVGTVGLSAQGASIAQTAVPIAEINTALYRVSWYVRVTRAATTSSSIEPRFYWDDGGVACSYIGAATSLNTTGAYLTGTLFIRTKAGTTIDYSTVYASVGATAMQYSLDITVESVPVPPTQ